MQGLSKREEYLCFTMPWFVVDRSIRKKRIMKNVSSSISRRNFVMGSALGAAGLALASPALAFADTTPAEPMPSIVVSVKDMHGNVVDATGMAVPRSVGGLVCLDNTTRSVTENADGSFTAVCETSVVPAAARSTIKDNTYNDLGVTIKVSVMYTFSRGKITVQSGSVVLTNVAPEATWTSKWMIVCQGVWANMNQVQTEFTGLEHVLITGFPEIDYVPSGASGMNGTNFQGVMSAKDMPEHLVTAAVQV